MSVPIRLTLNGASVAAEVEPRQHLADFLRETLLLTGTHLGCEHGVCGACTLLIEGAPARSCIAFAAACDGARIETIEGLEHDPVIERLRAAFTAEHALQCGYCTPGMLVTARDIVLRLPDADEARIRLELAGNLCRCTGYAGIVRAILRVLPETRLSAPVAALPVPAPLAAWAEASFNDGTADPPRPLSGGGRLGDTDRDVISQRLRIAAPVAAAWQAVQDPVLIAACVPGARLTGQRDGAIEGELALSLGPIQASFTGSATLGFGPDRTGWLRGEGRDRRSGTRLSVELDFAVRPDGAAASIVDLSVRYSLRGPLAQFARGAIATSFASELAETVGANLAARLSGTTPPIAEAQRLGLGRLLWRALLRWLGGRR